MLPAIKVKKLWKKLAPDKQKISPWPQGLQERCDALIPFGKPIRPKGSASRHNNKCCNPLPDGCTGVPNFDFKDVCDLHDLDYAVGGTEADRRRADEALRQGILDRDHPILARVYFIGVRLLGKRAFCFHEAGAPLCEANPSQDLLTQDLLTQDQPVSLFDKTITLNRFL